MGTLDSNGIYIYDTNDNVAPLATLLNLGQSATSAAITEAKQDVVDELTPHDTGWVTSNFLSMTSGWSNRGTASQTRIRRIGNWVYLSLYITRTGGSIAVTNTGNVTNHNVCVLQPAWHSNFGMQIIMGRERIATFAVGANGTVGLSGVAGTKNIATGDGFVIHGWYYRA